MFIVENERSGRTNIVKHIIDTVDVNQFEKHQGDRHRLNWRKPRKFSCAREKERLKHEILYGL